MTSFARTFALILASGLASHAAAQTTDTTAPSPPRLDGDWSFAAIPESKATLAVAEFSSGLGLVARCVDGTFDVLVHGLPAAPGRETTREIALAVGEDGEERTTVWQVGTDRTTAFSRLPARVARQLAEGGKLQVIVPGAEGERRTRYEMQLSPSGEAIEKTLTACGRPLVDPRDTRAEGNGQSGLPAPITWARTPQPNYPMFPGVAGEGYVGLSCVVSDDGRLNDCQIESEHPPRQFFGQAVERSLGRARVKLDDDGVASGQTLGGRMIVFVVAFRLD